MTKQEEYEKLLTLKKIFQATFEQTPEITIYEDKHWYLTAEWRFILTFSDQGDLFVMFDDDINPLLSAKIIQCCLRQIINSRLVKIIIIVYSIIVFIMAIK